MSHLTLRRLLLPCAALLAWCLSGGGAAAQNDKLLESISEPGPVGKMRDIAVIKVPDNCRFISKPANIKKFNDLTKNLHSPQDCGFLVPTDAGWFIAFAFDDIGKVPDDEKDKINAAELLSSMRENEVEANKERKRQGFPALTIVGWEKPPFFDDKTKNLTWALKLNTEGTENVNYEARILGRRGVMRATLVCGVDELKELIPVFDGVIAGYTYNDGQKYSDWKSGDKVAAIGLTGLIAGGAGVLAAKSGLLQLLLKGGKAVFVAIAAAIAGIVGFFKKLFGRGQAAAE